MGCFCDAFIPMSGNLAPEQLKLGYRLFLAALGEFRHEASKDP